MREVAAGISTEARAAAAERAAVIEANTLASQNAVSAAERVPANVRYVHEQAVFATMTPSSSSPNSTPQNGFAAAFLHCTERGEFKRAEPIARFDNTCIIESQETRFVVIYSAAAPSAFEALVRTERALNGVVSSSRSTAFTAASRLNQLEQQVAPKIRTIARIYGLAVAVAWIDAYARVYDGRVFVTRRELYVEWLRRRWASATAVVWRPRRP